ncbi:hypothetical protein TvY486_0004070 [Trypanosoma vivax Y486]|uniref:Uncharacterized protein n=1 Tax=Trypanosoma vivax (strain Y486) TaxID=1055687 RepID=F9WVS4_TRYVY|nr:hypothetical protein TvY486_0004070 [Trypanosoma vivax Y486]|eukprot:CCD21684.1 hypothetical protein TvY486_0004070 [Trypanosoma vivax Y486]
MNELGVWSDVKPPARIVVLLGGRCRHADIWKESGPTLTRRRLSFVCKSGCPPFSPFFCLLHFASRHFPLLGACNAQLILIQNETIKNVHPLIIFFSSAES